MQLLHPHLVRPLNPHKGEAPLVESVHLLLDPPLLSQFLDESVHMVHPVCLEHKDEMYKDTPTRYPTCWYIIGKI